MKFIDLFYRAGGTVYFLNCNAYTKIGFTQHPMEQRLISLQIGNPYPLEVWGLMPGTLQTERQLQSLPNVHEGAVGGEWFLLSIAAKARLKQEIVTAGGRVIKSPYRLEARSASWRY